MTWLDETMRRLLTGIALVGVVQSAFGEDLSLEAGFRDPPTKARTRVFWRVFGPAWERGEIDYQLDLLKAAHVGGVMAFFMYPVAVDGDGVHNQRFLSPEFLVHLAYAARRCQELDLRFGIAGGTGWPFGGPTVNVADAAQQLRRSVAPTTANGSPRLPPLGDGEQVIAMFQGTNDITGRGFAHESAPLPAVDSGPISVYTATPTRMRVKRPALGGEGWVLDHYNAAATRRYLDQVVAPMLRAAPGLVQSIFCDSLEVYGANWTAELPQEFSRRRGLALRPLLPDVFESDSSRSPDARFAFWRTLSELTAERFTRELSDWAHRHGVQLEMEAYGTPPNPLSAARNIDVPTGEQYEWRGFSLSRLAASGAHLAGKRVVGAEAWTWLGLPNRLGDSLSDMKLASDLHFLAGINDLTAVDFAYSPRSAGAPGWLPYYGLVLNQNNPQWPWFRYLMDYTSRCQWLLRQGQPSAEVALYLPVEDQFAFGPADQMALGFRLRDHFVSGEKTDEFGLQTALRHRSDLISTLLAEGFNYDGLDFDTLNRFAIIRKGQLHCGDGNYRVLVLPRLIGVERRSLERILAFGRSGGTILVTGRWPERIYGGSAPLNPGPSRALLDELVGEIAPQAPVTRRRLGRGQVIWIPDERTALAQVLSELRPGVRLEPLQPEVGLVFRRTPSRDIYFLANVGDQPRRFTAGFRTAWKHAERWDPMTGRVERLPSEQDSDGFQQVALELPPRGSIFVLWGRSSVAAPPTPSFASEGQPLNVSWTLSFEGDKAPPQRQLEELISWTTWLEAKFFSGRGVYTGQFAWNRPVPQRAWLNLTRIAEVAEISLNGHSVGVVWTPPAEVEITEWLNVGTNSLRITVANLPLNRFLGSPEEDMKPLRAAFGDRFPAPTETQTAQPATSGLIGPVSIQFSRK
jgi:hypothetical protein